MSMMSDLEAIDLLSSCLPLAQKLEQLATRTGEEFVSAEYLETLIDTPDEQVLYNFKRVWNTSLVTKEHIRAGAGLNSHELLVLAHLLSLYDTLRWKRFYQKK